MVPLRGSIGGIPAEMSVAEASALFPGFRFSPTDEELIQYYLRKKLQGSDLGIEVITEVDICKYEPWELPGQAVIHSENEWFFFTPRGRKYPNGTQSKRATQSGYWKATGKERIMRMGSNIVGTKRTLVFHIGRAPKGQRTEWIMHEYCTSEKSQDPMVICRIRKNNDFHLNESSRRSDQELSIETNTKTTLSGSEKSGMCRSMKPDDSLSNQCSSSSNLFSTEQTAACTESDDKHSSIKKKYSEEEDFYADIMEDDIIKLDDSALDENEEPCIRSKQKQVPPSLQPFQGTANRRIRLRKLRSRCLSAKLLHQRKLPHLTTERWGKRSANNRIIIGFLLFLFVMIASMIVVSVLGDFWLKKVKNCEMFSQSCHDMKQKSC